MVRKSRHIVFLLVILLPLACASPSAPVSAGPLAAEVIQVFFSPHGGVTDAVVRELGSAKKEILVQAYSVTSAPIAKALVDAHKRGVKGAVVLDRICTSRNVEGI
jgi:phosphatidylserine/phosphatidylglycerophosphate/cardiolipin synthase-like enzyme